MGTLTTLKSHSKHWLGVTVIRLFPKRSKMIEKDIGHVRRNVLDKIIRAGILRQAGTHDRIASYHHLFWAGAQGGNFARDHTSRFEAWFKREHYDIVQQIEDVIRTSNGKLHHFVEIGCGDGQVIHFLSKRLTNVQHFLGIDINREVIESNIRKYPGSKVQFTCANFQDWIRKNGQSGAIFFSNGGVLEYFSRSQITAILNKIATDLRPSAFALIEPLAMDFDLNSEMESRPHGLEWSFSHNYRDVFKKAGFRIVYQSEMITGGYRWIIMVNTI